MVLRRRTSADLASIVGWVPDRDALYLFSGPRLRWPLTEEQLGLLDGVDGTSAWVLVDQSKPDALLGHVDLTCSGTEARLGRVIIDPERRGEGLGSTLVNLALDKARELGIIRVDLNVIVGNVPAIRIYERLGFVAQDSSERPDVILMATDLDTVESAR